MAESIAIGWNVAANDGGEAGQAESPAEVERRVMAFLDGWHVI